MTVAIVHEIFLPVINGVITSTKNLAQNLAHQGIRVIFIAAAGRKYNPPYLEGIKVLYVPSIPSFIYPQLRIVAPWSRRVERIIEAEKVDIVHITGQGLLSWTALRGARRRCIPVVHSFHTLIFKESYLRYAVAVHPLIPLMQKLIWRQIAAFVRGSTHTTAPSRYMCTALQQKFPETAITRIDNGIDLQSFRGYADFQELVGNYPGFTRKTLLFVGRLGEEKSVGLLLEAFAQAYSRDKELRLFIVGDGPGRAGYEQTVRRQHLQGVVQFTGRLPHEQLVHSGLYQHARAFVTAATTENQPLTLIEAIAGGSPVVIPEVEGIRELLKGNGVSFPAGDSTALADKMLQIANDANLHARCRAATEALGSQFDGALIARQFAELYRSEALNSEKTLCF